MRLVGFNPDALDSHAIYVPGDDGQAGVITGYRIATHDCALWNHALYRDSVFHQQRAEKLTRRHKQSVTRLSSRQRPADGSRVGRAHSNRMELRESLVGVGLVPRS